VERPRHGGPCERPRINDETTRGHRVRPCRCFLSVSLLSVFLKTPALRLPRRNKGRRTCSRVSSVNTNSIQQAQHQARSPLFVDSLDFVLIAHDGSNSHHGGLLFADMDAHQEDAACRLRAALVLHVHSSILGAYHFCMFPVHCR